MENTLSHFHFLRRWTQPYDDAAIALMSATPHVHVRINLARVRENAEAIRRQVGVPVLAVVKADAYGLGASEVATVLADLVEGFCFFSFAEAAAADLWERLAKPSLALGPPDADAWPDALLYRRFHVRPVVSNVRGARLLQAADPVLSVDTGMQRFACPAEQVEEALRAGGCREAMTHATRPEHAIQLADLLGGRGIRLHAASSSLLDQPEARLDAVRPGIALYRGAARVAARLVDVRDSTGPAGYTGFTVPRHGVILAGYSNGLRPGPCLVDGRPSRVLKVGTQSAYVQCAAGDKPGDKPGDKLVLLGESLTEDAVAAAWGTTPHAVLLNLARGGGKEYLGL